MSKILFIMFVFLVYIFMLFMFKNRVSNRIGIVLILITISVNLDYKFFINSIEYVYIHLFSSIMLMIVLALIGYSMLLRTKRVYLPRVNNRSYFYTMGFAYTFIITLIILQYNTLEIYDIDLFVHHLLIFLTNLFLLVWFYLTSKNSNNKQGNEIIFKSILVFSIVNSLLSIMQYIFNKSFLLSNPNASIDYTEGVKVVKRVWGVVGASNGAGNLGTILFAVLLYYLYKNRNLITLTAFILNCIFILLTLTRIAYLAVGVEFLIFIFFTYFKDLNYKKIFTRIMLIILCMIFFCIFIYILYDSVYEILILDRGATQSNRFVQFDKAIEIAMAHLSLGVGAGQYVYNAYMYYGFQDIVVHSQFLNVLVEQGIFSLIAYLFVYIYMFIILIKKFKEDIWFPIILFTGNFITSNFNPNQYYNVCIFIFMFLTFGLIFYENNFNSKKKVGI
ncbi:TPA: O-antigen ligase family protein [Bacillus albus]